MNSLIRALFPIIISLTIGHSVLADSDHPAFNAHLTFKQDTLHLHVSIPNMPTIGEESFILMEFVNAETQNAIEILETVDVSLWMPDMGHGSVPTTIEKELNDSGETIPGVYHVREVYFTMGGEWEINFTLTDAEGQKETQTFKIKLKGGHQH